MTGESRTSRTCRRNVEHLLPLICRGKTLLQLRSRFQLSRLPPSDFHWRGGVEISHDLVEPTVAPHSLPPVLFYGSTVLPRFHPLWQPFDKRAEEDPFHRSILSTVTSSFSCTVA